jgi:gamma-tubulin complex component 2
MCVQNRIRDFIRIHSRYEYGTISHAVSASIKDMMREFDLIITQLENLLVSGRLSLQKIIFLLQPTKMTLRTIDSLISRVQDVIGGEMIDRIHCSLLEQGNEKARKIHEHILIAATAPFLKMLSLWLYKGVLSDPYNEFFISENTSMLRETLQEDFNAHYWESRYTLRPQHIPRIMKSHGEKALTAGKYLNVILDCIASSDTDDNLSVMSYTLPPETPLVYDIDGTSNMIEVIDKTYQHSSAMLLRILEEKFFLSLHIRSLRRFFLLEHGDFFVQFMDTAHDELTKDVKDVGVARVQGLLQLAVHTSTLANDPNRDDLSCVLASHNLIQHLHLIQTAGEGVGNGNLGAMEGFSVLGGSQGLKGVEALTLEYKVGWPISIILSKRAITKYQLLSRLLFFSKHVEDRVLNCWQDHQNTKELGLRAEMGPSYCLRHRMLHFLQNFVYYMTIEVFTPRSHEMMQAMTTACDMDEMLRLHELFLDTCLKECLLASQDLLRILTKLTTTCLLFADQMKRFAGSNEILDRDVRGPKEGKADAGGKSSWVRGARIKVFTNLLYNHVLD